MVLEPPRRWPRPNVREVLKSRDLIYYLARRDVMVRYKQAIVGVIWVIIQPVLLAATFSVFLGLLAKVPSEDGIPYPVFVLSGMVIWLLFAGAVTLISQSTVENEALISKIYFPRMAMPVAALFPPVVDFIVAFFVVLGAALVYGYVPGPELLAAPFAVLLAMTTALGLGLWLAGLNVRYRDVSLLVPFLVLVGLFITPITYGFELVPAYLQPFYALNPMVGVIELFRWSLFGTDWPGCSS